MYLSVRIKITEHGLILQHMNKNNKLSLVTATFLVKSGVFQSNHPSVTRKSPTVLLTTLCIYDGDEFKT